MPTLPQPDAQAQEQSQKLIRLLEHTINQAGPLSFADYMQAALYTPELGYYSSPYPKFGKEGDFVTAPEVSPLFSHCIAKQCVPILKTLPDAAILEFGAGAGTMAADILLYLESVQQLPTHYYILELSAYLQAQQHATFIKRAPHLLTKVSWLKSLPENFVGIMLANEVLDAMPVIRFKYADTKLYTSVIEWQGQLTESWQALDLESAEAQIIKDLALTETTAYISEYNPQLVPWINSLSTSLKQGLILLIDYGFPRHEYYHPQRQQGTLMCHYKHYAHSDFLWYPGLQDLTAHVDFTAIAEAARAAALSVAAYTDQASFLLGCGLLELANPISTTDDKARIQLSQQIQTLTMPMEMGELFKVMALTRDLNSTSLFGLNFQDKRHRL